MNAVTHLIAAIAQQLSPTGVVVVFNQWESAEIPLIARELCL